MQINARRLRRLREDQGLAQHAAADAAGISKSYLSMLENGARSNVSVAVAARLAGVLGVAVADLRPRSPRLSAPQGRTRTPRP